MDFWYLRGIRVWKFYIYNYFFILNGYLKQSKQITDIDLVDSIIIFNLKKIWTKRYLNNQQHIIQNKSKLTLKTISEWRIWKFATRLKNEYNKAKKLKANTDI